MHRNLNEYVRVYNLRSKAFKTPALSLDSAKDRQTLAGMIDSALSPENLSCDGELSRAQVRAKLKDLTAVATELLALDPSLEISEI